MRSQRLIALFLALAQGLTPLHAQMPSEAA